MILAGKRFLWIWLCIGLLGGSAVAGVSIEYIEGISFTDMSADGTVLCGNSISYEACRYTVADSIVPLGMSTTAVFGTGAGSPDISDDGVWISATILGADSTYTTAGRWSETTGWIETAPPLPEGGEPLSQDYASAWGLSGDGSVLTGLFWYPGQAGGGAHAFSWTAAGGMIDIGVDGSTSRANAASADGAVICGWNTAPFGNWMPCVWENGVQTILNDGDASCAAEYVSAGGLTIYGNAYDPSTDIRTAARWSKATGVWKEELLGCLSGTSSGQGYSCALDATADGRLVVGYNSRYIGEMSGTIWTRDTGLIEITDFLSDNGIAVDPYIAYQSVTCVSDDGTVMAGCGQQLTYPFGYVGFIITTGFATEVPEQAPRLSLARNYPNPFNPSTSIPVEMSARGRARVEVYDAAGRRIKVLHDGELPAGRTRLRWDGTDARGFAAPSGVYLARAVDGTGAVANRRMTLVK